MLCLQRNIDEVVDIFVPPSDRGTHISVMVVDLTTKNKIRGLRLGFEAPREVAIHRREIYEAIQRENGDG